MAENAIATLPPKANVQQLLERVGDKRLSFDARLTAVGDVMKATAAKIMMALPKHITPDRMWRVTVNCIRKNPKLMDCNYPSLFGAITEAATYGWELGGVLGHAYLVPYGNEVVLIPGYKGLVDLCRRSGQISTISCETVHQGDEFRYSLGDDPHIHHKPNDTDPKRDSRPITHVYLVVRLRDGGIQRSVWSQQKIDAHKEQYSQSWRRAEAGKKDSFWHTAWPSAAKKTVIRDMIQRGLLPVSAEYREVVDRGLKHDDDGGSIDFGAFDVVPPEPDGFDRPETGDDLNQDLIDLARMDLSQCNDDPGIEHCLHELLSGRTENEATIAAVKGEAAERRKELKKGKK